MNESQFVTSFHTWKAFPLYLYASSWLARSMVSLCQIAVVLGNSYVTVTCWFILAPVVEWDIPEGNELLNTCLLISFCWMMECMCFDHGKQFQFFSHYLFIVYLFLRLGLDFSLKFSFMFNRQFWVLIFIWCFLYVQFELVLF